MVPGAASAPSHPGDGVSFRAAAPTPARRGIAPARHQETIRPMAKRQRGGARPGQRAPLQRGGQAASTSAAKSAAATSPGGLSAGEMDRAAELEAQIVAEERAAATSMSRGRGRRGSADTMPASRSRAGGSLAVVSEEEYHYVVRDLRRIVVVFAGIFSLLLLSWLLIVVFGVVKV